MLWDWHILFNGIWDKGYVIQLDLGLVYLIQWDLGSLYVAIWHIYVIGNWVDLFPGIWD